MRGESFEPGGCSATPTSFCAAAMAPLAPPPAAGAAAGAAGGGPDWTPLSEERKPLWPLALVEDGGVGGLGATIWSISAMRAMTACRLTVLCHRPGPARASKAAGARGVGRAERRGP